MPDRLRKQLESGGNADERQHAHSDDGSNQIRSIGNQTIGLIRVLANLSELDDSVEMAYLCHPSVQHISKTRREGNFCGYRNIQMLISYICGAKAQGYEIFEDELPSVLRLQDLIEDAWNKGFNAQSRIETGGIKGTRKYIGTPEVCVTSF